MTSKAVKAEIAYQASIIPFKQMLKSGFISLEDYAKIDTILNKKYRPFFVEYMPQKEVDICSVQR